MLFLSRAVALQSVVVRWSTGNHVSGDIGLISSQATGQKTALTAVLHQSVNQVERLLSIFSYIALPMLMSALVS